MAILTETIKEKKFPVDIFAVKEHGIEKWQAEFFWPVSDDEFENLYQDIERYFIAQINSQPDEIKMLAGIQYKLKVEYENFLHALKVIQQIQSQGKKILYSDKTWWYKSLIETIPVDIHIATLRTRKHSFVNEIKIKARALIQSLVYNKNFLKYFIPLRKKEVIQLFSPVKPIVRQYVTKISDWVYFITQWDWLPKRIVYKAPSELKKKIEKFSKSMTDGLNSIANKYGVKLLDNHIQHLQELTGNELIHTAQALYLIKSKLKKNKQKVHLLISAGGDLFSRILSVAIRQCGGKVTSFVHGGDVGFINSPISLGPFFDISLVDEVITYTKESAALFKRINNSYSHCREYKTRIISGESDEYFKLWKKYGSGILPKKNKKVMLIGYAHNQRRRTFVKGGFSLTNLDLELRLVEFLKKAGYEVFYKAHPGRMAEVEGIFENRTQILKGYFESHVDKADVFLFPNITTTAFAIALCTNKAIVTLDISFTLFEPFPAAMELFRKRCKIVNTKSDERNRIIFDEKGLLDALARKVRQPNTEFIEKYMFPEKVKADSL